MMKLGGKHSARRTVVLGIALTVLLAVACTKDKVVLGAQCPGPEDPGAVVDWGPDAGASPRALAYGTSCAPCENAKPNLDERGCPTYVTFESCNGDICLGAARLMRIVPIPRDAGDADGGGSSPDPATEDAGGSN